MSLKVIFAGTPEFAAEHLRAVLNSDHEVIAVYTRPDQPAGRGRKLTASPVKTVAEQADIPVYQPATLRDTDAQTQLAALNADLMIVVAYGLILPQTVLDAPRLGCINVHASLLPRWRGAAPIHRALLAGDIETGVTIMQMNAGLDTGDMLLKARCPITPDMTSERLHDALIECGKPALIDTLASLNTGTAKAEPQDDAEATYAEKLSKAEGNINWSDSADHIDRQIRGLTPWPGAYTQWQGQTLRIHQARPGDRIATKPPGTIEQMGSDNMVVACGRGTLVVERLQMPGKKAMSAADVLNARRAAFEADPIFGNTQPQPTEAAQ
ncbi:methionyl-tRNA formyltransferase [Saccharospirillum impatiens]|uniref:methionyl-tRNA formyltransferase n=1 Tax=Saccharospirillum impatiens TaxID=169438 RepID=UPI000415B8C0|nr:methionyl-tRNA formyltransferase [Saccharospirillum impatiens]